MPFLLENGISWGACAAHSARGPEFNRTLGSMLGVEPTEEDRKTERKKKKDRKKESGVSFSVSVCKCRCLVVPAVLLSNWPLGLQLMVSLTRVSVSASLLPRDPAFYLEQAKLFSFCHSFLL